MSPESLFALANPLALLGWLALALSPLAPRLADLVAGLVLPLLLSVAYGALILAFWTSAPGGFGSLAEVQALFTDPGIALAGWLHYLAFDLFIGAWETRRARAEAIPHLLLLPCLALTFLFGPIGLLAFTALRATRRATTQTGVAP
ncbi:ABA4-like family protein [Oceaniglobus roseus]|uniref:ABA4-like family protein n=1 Tax=Oceaniglobus roseus TaxID=1737570 RepID=UPI000C7F398D|nr:ABA4-like family protein [Kandeliimicrobium roseum]